jgi:serine protease inhibitor
VAASVLNLSKQILTAVLRSKNSNKYLMVSPTSISSALSLALAGARGRTYEELMKTLQLPFAENTCELHEQFGKLLRDLVAVDEGRNKVVSDAPDAEVNEYDEDFDEDYEEGPREHKIAVANALFVQRNFNIRRDYKQAVQNVYQATINDVDYMNAPGEAASYINR